MAERRHQLIAHPPQRRWDDPRNEQRLWHWRGVTSGTVYTVYRGGKLKKQILSVTVGDKTLGIVLNDDSVSSRGGIAAW